MELKLFKLLSTEEFSESLFKEELNFWNPLSKLQYLDDANKLSRAMLFDKKNADYDRRLIIKRLSEITLTDDQWQNLIYYLERITNIQKYNKIRMKLISGIIALILSVIISVVIFKNINSGFSSAFTAIIALCINSIVEDRYMSNLSGIKNLSLYIKMHKLNKND